MNREVYLRTVLKSVPRIISQLNRNPASNSYGSFDREYWHYKTSDFSCGRKQEAVLTLALLYTIKHKENEYYNSPLILEWIEAALNFWANNQAKNGSFSEWYPHENSYVTTAFSSFAVSEVVLLLKGKIKCRNRVIRGLIKSANWLSLGFENIAQNQESGSIVFFFNMHAITRNAKYKKIAMDKFSRLAKEQDQEGWFSEYNGADIGYLSLLIDYLSKSYRITKDKRILGVVNKGIDFLSYFLHPDNLSGGEYGSRNTEYLIPSGFEIMAGLNSNAKVVAYHIRKGLDLGVSISPETLDDRYLNYISYNWLNAYVYGMDNIVNQKPKSLSVFTKEFKNAGIIIKSTSKYYLIVNYKQGGVFRLVDKKRGKSISDSGAIVFINGKKYLSKIIQDTDVEFIDDDIIIKGNLGSFKEQELGPIKNIMLRLFQVTIGRNRRISCDIKGFLRRILITNNNLLNDTFVRHFSFDNGIKVVDVIESKKKIKKLILGVKASFKYIPSSKYFSVSELSNNPVVLNPNSNKVVYERHYKI